MMSRPHPIARTALVYAGAQKNLGPAGVVLTIVRKDLYERIGKSVPKIWSFKALAEAKSCLNTPPTFGVYFLLETFKWLEAQGGLAAVEKKNAEKAALVYGAIDASGGFYKGTVADKAARSHMNLTFLLPSEELTDKFVKEASEGGHGGAQGLPHRRRHPRVDVQRDAARGREGAGRLHGHVREEQRVETGSRVPGPLSLTLSPLRGARGPELRGARGPELRGARGRS